MKRTTRLMCVLATVALGVLTGLTPRAEAGARAGDPVNGQKVYSAQKCSMCHKIAGVGAAIGSDLTAVGARRDAAWLAKYLVAPTVLDPARPPKVKMPPAKVRGQDLDDLIAYLLTLKGKK